MLRRTALTLVPAAVALMTTAGLLLGTAEIVGRPQGPTDGTPVVHAATVSATTRPDCLTARRGAPAAAPASLDEQESPILPPHRIVLSTSEDAGRPLPPAPLDRCDRHPSAVDPRQRS